MESRNWDQEHTDDDEDVVVVVAFSALLLPDMVVYPA